MSGFFGGVDRAPPAAPAPVAGSVKTEAALVPQEPRRGKKKKTELTGGLFDELPETGTPYPYIMGME